MTTRPSKRRGRKTVKAWAWKSHDGDLLEVVGGEKPPISRPVYWDLRFKKWTRYKGRYVEVQIVELPTKGPRRG